MGQSLSTCFDGASTNGPPKKVEPPAVEEEEDVKPPENVKCAADIDFSWPRNFTEKYKVEDIIGQGCFADVSLAKSLETGESVAVKTIPKQKVFEDYSLFEDVKREASIMEVMNHCLNTCSLYGKFEDDTGAILVMELCSGKDLFDHLHAHEYSERSAARVTREVLRMLAACHHRGVVHRDIKPENLIFSREGADAPLKVIDFGLAAFCAADQTLDEIVGTPFYMAPEAIKGKFCQKSELWALGCILYKLLSGRDPFMRKDIRQCLMAIQAGEVEMESDPWPRVSEEGKAFVRLLLTKDPKDRPTALEALEQEWVRQEERMPGEEHGLDDTIIQRLQMYSDLVADRRAALAIVSSKLISFEDEENAVRDARRLFNEMDKSGTGRLTREEFTQGLREHGYELSDHEIKLLEEQLELEDEQSSINFSRFLSFACPWEELSKRPGFLQSVMEMTFHEMDADKDGSIHVEDIKAYLDHQAGMGNPLTPKGVDSLTYANHLMELWDTNHTGHVTLEGFDHAMEELANNDHLPVDAYESRVPKVKPWSLKGLRKTLSLNSKFKADKAPSPRSKSSRANSLEGGSPKERLGKSRSLKSEHRGGGGDLRKSPSPRAGEATGAHVNGASPKAPASPKGSASRYGSVSPTGGGDPVAPRKSSLSPESENVNGCGPESADTGVAAGLNGDALHEDTGVENGGVEEPPR